MSKLKFSKKQIATFIVILMLFVSLIPIFLISRYNVPYFDDFNHGYLTYQSIQNGSGFIEIIKIAAEQVKNMYINWQGCYSGIFLSAIHPGIFGENYYGIGSIIMFVIHIFSVLYFSNIVFCKMFKMKGCWLIVGGLIAFIQIQYLPSVQEGFFWWAGAVMHTFMFDLMMILFAIILKQIVLKEKSILNMLISLLLIVVCGGGAYEVALFLPIALIAILICFFVYRKKNNKRIDDFRISLLFIYIFASIVCLLINVLAPGNAIRIESTGVSMNPLLAIIESFIYSMVHIIEYFSIRVILVLIIIFYLIFPKIKCLNFKFINIKLYTFGVWCLFSVIFTPAIYAENYVAAPRYLNIIYFASYWIFILEFLYFVWYFRNNILLNDCYNLLNNVIKNMKLSYFSVSCIFLFSSAVLNMSYSDATSSSAFLDLLLGNAQHYKEYYDETFSILKSDDSTVEIEELKYKVRVFPDNNNDDAILEAYMKYYDKDKIIVISNQ